LSTLFADPKPSSVRADAIRKRLAYGRARGWHRPTSQSRWVDGPARTRRVDQLPGIGWVDDVVDLEKRWGI
jgi:hypothetical protein